MSYFWSYWQNAQYPSFSVLHFILLFIHSDEHKRFRDSNKAVALLSFYSSFLTANLNVAFHNTFTASASFPQTQKACDDNTKRSNLSYWRKLNNFRTPVPGVESRAPAFAIYLFLKNATVRHTGGSNRRLRVVGVGLWCMYAIRLALRLCLPHIHWVLHSNLLHVVLTVRRN